MLVLIYVFTLVYCGLIGLLLFNWSKINAYAAVQTAPYPFISIIVAVRNESANIVSLLEDMALQQYPKDRFEVIVIDDHSTDTTYRLVEAYQSRAPYRLHLLQREKLEGGVAYKKAAIAQGVNHAAGELIITTDGDCRVGEKWLGSFAACYQQTGARLISGPVAFYGESSLFQQMQSIEFASLIGLGAAAMQAGMPLMCNGANLCYQKAAFHSVGGYSSTTHIPSGDDEHLMRKIAKQFPGQLVFNKSKEAIVLTLPKATFQEFKQQRIRWAGKWKYSNDAGSRLMAVFLFVYHLLLLGFVIAGMLGVVIWPLVVGITAKLWCEGVFLRKVMKQMNKPFKLDVLLLLQLVYPLYVVYFGLLIHLVKNYTWKDRKISS